MEGHLESQGDSLLRGNNEQAFHVPAITLGHPRLPFPLLESWAQIPGGWSYHHDKASLYNKGQLSLGLLVHQRLLGAPDPQWQRSQGLECGRSRGRRKWGVVNHAPLGTRPPQSDMVFCPSHLTGHVPAQVRGGKYKPTMCASTVRRTRNPTTALVATTTRP